MAVEMEIHPSVLNSAPGSDEAVAAQARKDRAERIKGYREAPDPSSSSEEPQRFSPPGEKLTIASLDDEELEVSAQYNPKEIQFGRYIQWQLQTSPELNKLALEFSGEDGRTFQLELLFDGYEEGISIQGELDKLEELTSASVSIEANDVTKLNKKFLDAKTYSGRPKTHTEERPKSGSEAESVKRPHFCFVSWGKWLAKPFTCIIETVTTRYQMFSESGEPLRALVTLAIREAHSVGMASMADRKRAGELQKEQQQKGPERAGGLPFGATNIPNTNLPGPNVRGAPGSGYVQSTPTGPNTGK